MVAFPQTYWTMIRRAVLSSRTALNLIASDYAAPVRGFIRRSGFSPEDAEDLAQEVFMIACSPDFLKQADASKGKFRTLVLLVTKNVMNAEWRKRYAKTGSTGSWPSRGSRRRPTRTWRASSGRRGSRRS